MVKKRMIKYLKKYIKSKRSKGKSFAKIFYNLVHLILACFWEVDMEKALKSRDNKIKVPDDIEDLDDFWN